MASSTPVALITGAAHRLGSHTARHLHQRGWSVVIHYRSREADANMNTNLRAPFFLGQACLPALKLSRGAIVNLIDIYSQRPLANHPLYCASKSGLASLTLSWAKDLAPEVRVNGVSPGAILWPEGDAAIDEGYQQSILAKTPLARTGKPEDIADAIAFLLCDAPFVTGQILAVDGGRSLNM
ncbi:SDR family oxidoreductase [Marinobacter salarius]